MLGTEQALSKHILSFKIGKYQEENQNGQCVFTLLPKLESGELPSAGRALARELRHLESLSGSILIFKRLNMAHIISSINTSQFRFFVHCENFSGSNKMREELERKLCWNFLELSVHLIIFPVIGSNFWSALQATVWTQWLFQVTPKWKKSLPVAAALTSFTYMNM